MIQQTQHKINWSFDETVEIKSNQIWLTSEDFDSQHSFLYPQLSLPSDQFEVELIGSIILKPTKEQNFNFYIINLGKKKKNSIQIQQIQADEVLDKKVQMEGISFVLVVNTQYDSAILTQMQDLDHQQLEFCEDAAKDCCYHRRIFLRTVTSQDPQQYLLTDFISKNDLIDKEFESTIETITATEQNAKIETTASICNEKQFTMIPTYGLGGSIQINLNLNIIVDLNNKQKLQLTNAQRTFDIQVLDPALYLYDLTPELILKRQKQNIYFMLEAITHKNIESQVNFTISSINVKTAQTYVLQEQLSIDEYIAQNFDYHGQDFLSAILNSINVKSQLLDDASVHIRNIKAFMEELLQKQKEQKELEQLDKTKLQIEACLIILQFSETNISHYRDSETHKQIQNNLQSGHDLKGKNSMEESEQNAFQSVLHLLNLKMQELVFDMEIFQEAVKVAEQFQNPLQKLAQIAEQNKAISYRLSQHYEMTQRLINKEIGQILAVKSQQFTHLAGITSKFNLFAIIILLVIIIYMLALKMQQFEVAANNHLHSNQSFKYQEMRNL